MDSPGPFIKSLCQSVGALLFFLFGKEKPPKESGKVFFFFLILFLVEKYYMFTVKGTEKESFKNNYS